MAAAEINGITIEYESHGDERAAETMLLVMGLGGQLVAWSMDWVNRFVEAGFRVIRFDNRDIGLSTTFDDFVVRRRHLVRAALAPKRAPAPYQLGDMAEDAAALLDHLGVERAHVVGVSMGGMISQELAIRRPGQVVSLASIMSSAGDRRHGLPKLSVLRTVLTSRSPNPDDALATSMRIFRAISGPLFDEDEVRQLAKESLARHFDTVGPARQILAILTSPDRTPALRRLDLPTLVVHGLADPLVTPSGGVATARAIPGSRLLMFPDMGHDLPRERWDEIIPAIIDNTRRAV